MLLALLGCATWHYPGPLGQLGREAPETAAQWIARKYDPPEGGDEAATGSLKSRPPNALARDIVRAANGFVGNRSLSVDGTAYRYDCSGLVEASLATAGLEETGSSAMLFERARELGVLHHRRAPKPGDIAFFDNTYDRDSNGRNDDSLTHSAVVVAVDSDGTVDMVHVGSKGVTELRMNLRNPHDLELDGVRLNDYLRSKTGRDPASTQYLAGELWTGFGSFWAAQ